MCQFWMEVTQLRTDTLTGQSGHNFLFVDAMTNHAGWAGVYVCVWIYETLHSSFSSSVATWVVVCLIRASPASPPASWQHCGPIYGLRRQINQQTSWQITRHQHWSEWEWEQLRFRKEDTACLMQQAPLRLCHSLIETNTFVKYQKKGVSQSVTASFQDTVAFF